MVSGRQRSKVVTGSSQTQTLHRNPYFTLPRYPSQFKRIVFSFTYTLIHKRHRLYHIQFVLHKYSLCEGYTFLYSYCRLLYSRHSIGTRSTFHNQNQKNAHLQAQGIVLDRTILFGSITSFIASKTEMFIGFLSKKINYSINRGNILTIQ